MISFLISKVVLIGCKNSIEIFEKLEFSHGNFDKSKTFYIFQMHLIHLLQNETKNVTHNIAVLGILFKLANEDNQWFEDAIAPIFNKLVYKGILIHLFIFIQDIFYI